jgi:hypothetical protein
MKPITRSLFPTLASFGPLFIVIGTPVGGTGFLRVLALVGALMTSAALLILFRAILRVGGAGSEVNRP